VSEVARLASVFVSDTAWPGLWAKTAL